MALAIKNPIGRVILYDDVTGQQYYSVDTPNDDGFYAVDSEGVATTITADQAEANAGLILFVSGGEVSVVDMPDALSVRPYDQFTFGEINSLINSLTDEQIKKALALLIYINRSNIPADIQTL